MVHLHHLPPARDDDMCTMCILPASQISRNYSKLVRTLPIEKKQIQIKIVLVFILSRYWFKSIIFLLGALSVVPIKELFFEKWVPDRVPTWVPDRVPIRGPEGARKRK